MPLSGLYFHHLVVEIVLRFRADILLIGALVTSRDHIGHLKF
jgi:hypothetical protein